jgi:2-oxoacid:acceptor oxidoreductase delta subunit (pyruvate/2-ketoisovalerate family)
MSQKKERGWTEIPRGGLILEAGNATEYETGSWRTMRPIRDEEKCVHCLRCWIYCPDSAIMVEDGKVVGIDLEHCKGCGICAYECPPRVKAITMVLETEAAKND